MGDIERGQVMLSDSSPKMQTLQVEVWGADDPRDDCEHFEPYGLTARPCDPDSIGGADALVAQLGSADHSVVIAVGDRRYRIKGLGKGDVAVYDYRGQYASLTDTGIDIKPASGKRVRVLGTDIELADNADAALAKWPALKVFMTGILAALNGARDSTMAPLSFTVPLPSVPNDSDGGCLYVKGK